MSASLRFTTNSAVYFVRFGTCGKLPSADALGGDGAVWPPANLDSEAPKSPNETPARAAFLKNARLFIALFVVLSLMRCHHSFQFVLEYVAVFHDELHALKLRHVGLSAWRDIHRGGSTLTLNEGQMKRYS